MANRSGNRGRPVRVVPAQPPLTAATPEPPVRRWPHPVDGVDPVRQEPSDPVFHYIRCALSYQNQLLSEIKTLLEQITVSQEEEEK